MQNRQYSSARFCYQRANAGSWTAVADAFILQQAAENLARSPKTSERERRKDAFLKAGRAFLSLERNPEWSNLAGICFARGGDHRNSGHAFLSVPLYTNAIHQFRECEDIDALYSIISNHRTSLKAKDAERLADHLKLYFCKSKDYK
jgi:hypothetical protein